MNQPPPDPRTPRPDPAPPAWLDEARPYYSRVGTAPALPVSVYDATGLDTFSEESPGRFCLRLEARSYWSPRVNVLDAGGEALGAIRPTGLVPGRGYAMSRGDDPVWTMAVRNLVRTRHSLVTAGGDRWTIVTPFFARLDIVGGRDGVPGLLGRIHSNWWGIWLWKIEPGRDTSDLLAALAFLHRQYGRS